MKTMHIAVSRFYVLFRYMRLPLFTLFTESEHWEVFHESIKMAPYAILGKTFLWNKSISPTNLLRSLGLFYMIIDDI